jgi:hypothetical protein
MPARFACATALDAAALGDQVERAFGPILGRKD